jgi:restriction endonuclease S subunit
MKDSGVEWIGEIPECWGVLQLKYLVKENSNSLSNSTDPNYKLKYIEISDINSNGTVSNTTDYIFSNCPSRCRRILKKGDVAISTVRTYLKSIFIIENEVIDLICSTGFSVLSPNKNVNSKHLFYMVRSEWFISSIISKSEGVSYPSIQSDKLMNTFVLNIPLKEQEQIVAYLDEKTSIIDKSISIEERRIGLLKEYRQSIISQVITGKIKVSADE